MAASIDDGPIVRQEHFPNEPDKSCREMYDIAVELGTGLVEWFVDQMISGDTPSASPQDERKATYYPPGFPGDFRVPWRQTLTFVLNYIRAAHFPPYEGAFTEIDGHRISFSWPIASKFCDPRALPGTFVQLEEGVGIATLNGVVLPQSVSFNGQDASFAEIVTKFSLINRSIIAV
jgi:methionyl-tRNA formyltransferase